MGEPRVLTLYHRLKQGTPWLRFVLQLCPSLLLPTQRTRTEPKP